jgi:DNA-binding CsgD family transcriptional regulator
MIGSMARRISSPVIVGRDDELALLRAAAARGADGELQVVLISGEAGVGKSRLIGQLAAEAPAAGTSIVIGGCPSLVDAPLPYAPIAAAMAAMLSDRSDAEIEPLVAGVAPDLVRLSPNVAARLGWIEPVAVPESLIPGRVFDAVRATFDRAARTRALVVVFEDLHWADASSLDLIGYLIRNADWPGAIVVTYRSDELHRRHPLLPWLAEIARVASVERIELERLSAADSAAQIEAIIGEVPARDLIDEVVRRAGGNAFLTEELLASRREGALPASGIKQLLLARVAALPDATRTTVEAMAVCPGTTDAALVAAATGRSEVDVEAAIHEALDSQILVASPGGAGYAFRHALLQEAVYDGLLPSERRRHHVGFANALESGVGAEGPGRAAGGRMAEVVHHALAANDLPTGFRASIEAGAAATAAGAFADAATHFERALQLFDSVPNAASIVDGGRSGLLALAAHAVSISGDPERAIRLWREAFESAGPGVPLDARVEMLLGVAHDYNEMLLNEEALAATHHANKLLEGEPESSLRARALADLARDLSVLNDGPASADAEKAAIAMATSIGDVRTEALARSRHAGSLLQLGRPDEARLEAEAALRIARTTRDRFLVITVFMNAAWNYEELGEPSISADLLVGEGLPLARELGLPTTALAAWGAGYLWEAGRWAEGRRVIEQAVPSAIRSGRGRALTIVEDLYDAVTRLEGVRPEAREPADPNDPVVWALAAEDAVWRGDPTRASELAIRGLEAAANAQRNGDHSWRGWLLRLAARAEADLATTATGARHGDERTAAAGRSADAAATARAFLEQGLREDLYGLDMLPNVLLAEAEAGRAAGANDPGAWLAAAEAWEAMDRVYEPAYARYRRAEALLTSSRRRAEARGDLKRAKAAAVELGALPMERLIDELAQRSRIELGAVGPHRPSSAGGPASSLTRRELDVLALLAEGRSNRQIAETLFISESTAGVHVSNILGKLGVSGRTEAAAVAFRAGIVSPTGEPSA